MKRHSHSMSSQRRRCSGLTLIELMVAMLLSLVLMGGVLTLFASSKTTFRLQSGLATVQENGRHALYMLVRDIRGAGFSGCAGIETNQGKMNAEPAPEDLDSLTGKDVLFGMDNVDANAADAAGNKYNAVPGTDLLRVRGAADSGISLLADEVPVNANIQLTTATQFFKEGDVLVLSDCETTDFFRATNVSQSGGKTTIAHSSTGNKTPFLSKPYGKDAFLYAFRSNTYFIRDTGRTNAVGDPIRALYRRNIEFDPTLNNDEELVDGVEDMQVTYGVDGDGNGFVDQFVDAPAATSDDWEKVRAVRVSLLVSSVDNAHSEPVPYNYVGLSSTPVDPTDFKLRQEVASTVTIRNRVN